VFALVRTPVTSSLHIYEINQAVWKLEPACGFGVVVVVLNGPCSYSMVIPFRPSISLCRPWREAPRCIYTRVVWRVSVQSQTPLVDTSRTPRTKAKHRSTFLEDLRINPGNASQITTLR